MTKLSRLILATIFLFSVLCFLSSVSYAEVPHLINYQGKLTDSEDHILPDGEYDITFRIYHDPKEGASLWEEKWNDQTKRIRIQKGVFSILLGSINPLKPEHFENHCWLAIQVGQDAEMEPRQQIVSVGYAIKAEKAETAKEADLAAQAIDADTVDGKHASDFIEQGTAAGGDLAGTYPNPTVALFTHAGAILYASADTERSAVGPGYEKVKEIRVAYTGTYTVKFDLKSNTPGMDGCGKVYKNGIAYGAEQTQEQGDYVTKTEDLVFTAGDLVQLYIQSQEAGGYAYIQNFRLYTNNISTLSVIID